MVFPVLLIFDEFLLSLWLSCSLVVCGGGLVYCCVLLYINSLGCCIL